MDKKNKPLDVLKYKGALGRYPTGVCVISGEAMGRQVAMTVNSFTSVSLDPPLVSWCIDEGVRTYPVFASTGAFCIHILTADEQHLAEKYADFSQQGLDPSITKRTQSGAPQLNAGAVTLDCRIHDKIRLGDHLMLVGRVVDFDTNGHDSPMLGYFKGQYKTIQPPPT